MSDNTRARSQMQLLVDLMPYVPEDFALKGGTAINMFCRDLPRYSVDMDLVYIPRADRLTAVRSMHGLMEQMRRAAQRGLRGVTTSQVHGGKDEKAGLLWVEVRRGEVSVRIETPVSGRQTLYAPSILDAVSAAESEFGRARMKVVSFDEMYAGKVGASLGRRQLRDMFDIFHLFQHEGLTEDLFRTFLVYAVADGRPPHMILSRAWHARKLPEQKRWEELMRTTLPMDRLLATNAELRQQCADRITPQVRQFLLDVHDGSADPGVIGIPEAAIWPGFLWRLQQRALFKAKKPHEHARQRREIEGIGGNEYDTPSWGYSGVGKGDDSRATEICR